MKKKPLKRRKKNLENVISKMIEQATLSKEMINDNLIKNLTKYRLDELKEKVLIIKYPPEDDTRMRHLTEDEIMRLAFEKEI